MLLLGFAFGESQDAKEKTDLKFPETLPRLETVDGKVYENVKYIKVTASRVSFQHESGLASVLMVKLPADMQKLFGYDAKAAAALLEAERKAEASYHAAVAVDQAKVDAAKDKKSQALKQLDFVGSEGYKLGDNTYRVRVDSRIIFALMEAGYTEEEARKLVKERKK